VEQKAVEASIYRTSLLQIIELDPKLLCRLWLLLKHKEDIRGQAGNPKICLMNAILSTSFNYLSCNVFAVGMFKTANITELNVNSCDSFFVDRKILLDYSTDWYRLVEESKMTFPKRSLYFITSKF
jgi:hypothetical protein